MGRHDLKEMVRLSKRYTRIVARHRKLRNEWWRLCTHVFKLGGTRGSRILATRARVEKELRAIEKEGLVIIGKLRD
jgi:hypothetical protein